MMARRVTFRDGMSRVTSYDHGAEILRLLGIKYVVL